MRYVQSVVFAVAMLASSVASAADVPARPAASAPPYVAAPQYTWTGLYVGGVGGGGWGTSHHSVERIPIDFSGEFDVDGTFVGGTAGFNWQVGALVVGVEGDIATSWISGETGGVRFPFCPRGFRLIPSCRTELNSLGTARMRLGYAWDRVMPFVTGGVAFGNLEGSVDSGFNHGDDMQTGWTAGGGLEYMILPHLTAKAEYLYVDLGTADKLFSRNPGRGPFDVDFKANLIRLGLNYKFGS